MSKHVDEEVNEQKNPCNLQALKFNTTEHWKSVTVLRKEFRKVHTQDKKSYTWRQNLQKKKISVSLLLFDQWPKNGKVSTLSGCVYVCLYARLYVAVLTHESSHIIKVKIKTTCASRVGSGSN